MALSCGNTVTAGVAIPPLSVTERRSEPVRVSNACPSPARVAAWLDTGTLA